MASRYIFSANGAQGSLSTALWSVATLLAPMGAKSPWA